MGILLKYQKTIAIHIQYYLCIAILLLFITNIKAQQNWQSLGSDFNRYIWCFYPDTVENKLYIGGDFSKIDSTIVYGIAEWDGTNFSPLGCGVDWDCFSPVCAGCFPRPVYSLTKYKNEIYAGGSFLFVDSITVNGIAKWNGIKWDSLQKGVTFNSGSWGKIWFFLVFNDELYAGGMFEKAGSISARNIAKWDGNNWSNVGNYNYNGSTIFTMAAYNGKLYAAGIIQDSLNNPINIVCWDGIKWEIVGGGIKGLQSMIYGMAVYNGELYVGGNFSKADGNTGDFIQKWNGGTWSEVGGGVSGQYGNNVPVRRFQVFNNELWVIGDFDFAGGIPSRYIAKWNGTDWCSLGSNFIFPANAITSFRNDLYVGNYFFYIDSVVMPGLIKWTGGNYVDTCGNTSSVGEKDNEKNAMSVYPNPVTGNEFTVSFPFIKTGTLQVINLLGEALCTYEIRNTNKISINGASFKSGCYLLRVKSDSSIFTGKLVKQ
ncbi:MAG TPA: T9SS type A sorting domain-containing protein [Bacteroidales bacterium]|nr:T9SS type A sorting domain-containing protein [Bacteroidales bacterium]